MLSQSSRYVEIARLNILAILLIVRMKMFAISLLVLCFLVAMTQSSCAGSDPSFSPDFQPSVVRVSSTSVLVEWTKGHLINLECGDNFIVKYWPVDEPARWYKSNLLPLRVFEDVRTRAFNYTQNNQTFTYLVTGLDSLQSYSIQVVVTESRSIMGRSWYKSASSDVERLYYNSVKAQEEAIDRTMLIVAAIIVVLAILLILVGSAYNIHKCVRAKYTDWEEESEEEEEYQDYGDGIEPPEQFGNLNGNPFQLPPNKYVFQQQNSQNGNDRLREYNQT